MYLNYKPIFKGGPGWGAIPGSLGFLFYFPSIFPDEPQRLFSQSQVRFFGFVEPAPKIHER
jgi:hypothetical protein